MACQGIGLNGGEGGNMVNPMDVGAFFLEESENEKLLSSGAKSLSNMQLPCARPGLRRAQADLLGQKRHKEGELPVFFSIWKSDLMFPTESGYSDGK